MAFSKPNSPLINEYIERFDDTLEMIKELKLMGVLRSIRFPKIVVVGYESTDKSTLISNLIGLKLPSSIKTPFVVKFELHSVPNPDKKIFLRCKQAQGDNDIEISEHEIGTRFQQELETNYYLNLSVVIKQNDIPDLTIVDLPGIKQEKELEHIKGYIHECTNYEECVFVNVISASNGLTTCTSTKLISRFDLLGKRTVTVVTRIDETQLDTIKFTMNTITKPFGFTFVSNLSKKMSANEAQLASIIGKNHFGCTVVARKIVTAMLSILFKTSSFIVQQIDIDLKQCEKEMKPSADGDFKTVGEARSTILMIATKSQYSLYRLVIAQDYNQYQNDKQLHAYLRLSDKVGRFQTNLENLKLSTNTCFLVDEIEMLGDLDTLLPPWNIISSFFLNRLVHKKVDTASKLINSTVSNIFDYLEKLALRVISDHSVDHKRLNSSLKKPVISMLANIRRGFEQKVARILDLEKTFPSLRDPSFTLSWEKYRQVRLDLADLEKNVLVIDGLGQVEVSHLKQYAEPTWKAAFDMKMLICAYWEPVSTRIARNFSLCLMESLKDMVTGEMVMTVMEPFMNIGEEHKELADDEEPMLSVNRAILTNRTNYLNEAKEEIEKIQKDLQFLR